MRINRSSSPEWSRCIGIRNSHDRSLSVGLTAGITVLVCSNNAFGGSMVIKRRHTRQIRVRDLVIDAVDALEEEFLTLETVAEGLKIDEVGDDEVRASIVKASELRHPERLERVQGAETRGVRRADPVEFVERLH